MRILYIFIALLVAAGCGPKKEITPPIDVAAYKLEIDRWHQKRIDDLKGPGGWLNLVGLFWLNDGINTFGSGEKNTIVFPAGKIPERAGFFLLKNNSVTLDVAPDVKITSNGNPVKTMVVYNVDSTRQPVQEYGSLQWFVIRRDDKFGVRLRDFNSDGIQNFKGIDRFPVDLAWRLVARYEAAPDSNRMINITNVLGQTTPQPSPGALVFMVNGREQRLDVLNEGGDEYFIIVGDSTNTQETYGAGRYMYVPKAGADGLTIIDFNKAHNPPCAFTEFATCPLPPKQNVLTVAIKAGEKNYGTSH